MPSCRFSGSWLAVLNPPRETRRDPRRINGGLRASKYGGLKDGRTTEDNHYLVRPTVQEMLLRLQTRSLRRFQRDGDKRACRTYENHITDVNNILF